jgi:pimeloyl-ACP methyl ester carboxylesterase
MGHSLAGITLRGYAAQYPDNIAGMILVDGGTPLQETHGSPELQAKWQKIPWGKLASAVVLVEMGVPRMMGMCSKAKTADFGVGALQYESQCDPPLSTAIAEITQVHSDGLQTIHTGPFDFPVLIFSQDWSDPNELKGFGSKAITAEGIDQWNQMQEGEKQLSKDSRRIIAKGTDHYVQVERADLLLKEIPPFIQRIRAHAPPGPENGTTITE